MKKTVDIQSTNAASYVTVRTGVVGSVQRGLNEYTGRMENYYEFPYSEDVEDALSEYRYAVRNDKVLEVDLVDFMNKFRYYRNSSNRLTRRKR